MSEVDWSKAPDGVEFYAGGYFRKQDQNNIGWTMYYSELCVAWDCGASLDACLDSIDYEKRPILSGIAQQKEVTNTATQWTAKHYDNIYQLTPEDIERGDIKIDPYFVNKLWKLNEKDNTGALFHNLKTIARFTDKNPIEREIKALYNQTKRMAELYDVILEG